MSGLRVWQNSRVLCLGAVLILGLTLVIGLFLMMDFAHLPGVALADSPTIRYVAPAPVGNDSDNDCTIGGAPCATISYALDQAEELDTILVAGGTYTENLVITKTVTLKGGYEPTGWSRSLERETTIDGNQSNPVISVRSTLSETTRVDGFTITNGKTGFAIRLSSVFIENCRIIHNHNPTAGGGGLGIDHSYVAMTNTLIASNTARINGAMRIISTASIPGPHSRVSINSSTVTNNSTGIFVSNSSCQVINSIVWGHPGDDFTGFGCSTTYSNIEMELSGEGVISEDPRFVNPAIGNYRLRPDSPCIDSGSNDSAPETDLNGDSRPVDGDLDGIAVTDMGVDEFWPRVYLPLVLHNSR